jgi:hypothetical protein
MRYKNMLNLKPAKKHNMRIAHIFPGVRANNTKCVYFATPEILQNNTKCATGLIENNTTCACLKPSPGAGLNVFGALVQVAHVVPMFQWR